MKINNIILFLFFALVVSVSAQSKNSIVKIYAEYSNGRWSQGTGFFEFGNTNEVITCYHVIQNAKKIKLYFNDVELKNVVVYSISPKYDLAKLKIAKKQNYSSLQLIRNLSPATKVWAFGFPLGIDNFKHEGTMTSNNFIRSNKYINNERIFNEDIDLISLDMTIYDGMSGAPVVNQEGIIGVLSGSINQGGTLAWAIPIKYLDELTIVNEVPSKIKWIPLTLLKPNNTLLARKHLLNKSLYEKANDYYKKANKSDINSLIFEIQSTNLELKLLKAKNALASSKWNNVKDSISVDSMDVVIASCDDALNELLPWFESFAKTMTDFHDNFDTTIVLMKELFDSTMIDTNLVKNMDLTEKIKMQEMMNQFNLMAIDAMRCAGILAIKPQNVQQLAVPWINKYGKIGIVKIIPDEFIKDTQAIIDEIYSITADPCNKELRKTMRDIPKLLSNFFLLFLDI